MRKWRQPTTWYMGTFHGLHKWSRSPSIAACNFLQRSRHMEARWRPCSFCSMAVQSASDTEEKTCLSNIWSSCLVQVSWTGGTAWGKDLLGKAVSSGAGWSGGEGGRDKRRSLFSSGAIMVVGLFSCRCIIQASCGGVINRNFWAGVGGGDVRWLADATTFWCKCALVVV